MSPPVSYNFRVQDVPNAGRGVIATQHIPRSTVVLKSEGPVAHVIFRHYRKEVCASCFEYGRGRALPVRDYDTGKVFCSSRCQVMWLEQNDVPGVQAWKALHTFVQSQSKRISNTAELAPDDAKPSAEAISNAWQRAKGQVTLRRPAESGSAVKSTPMHKPSARPLPATIDPDVLSLFVSGLLFQYQYPERWTEDVMCLAMDDEPYKSAEELQAHCDGYVHLMRTLPRELVSDCASEVCRTLASVGSHNAFGIRSGSEDGDEYMGYSIYPLASYFNHSCMPTLSKQRVGQSWKFWAAKDIAVGEQCCITYLGGDEKDLTVVERRMRLRDVWGFDCQCERCLEEAAESSSSG